MFSFIYEYDPTNSGSSFDIYLIQSIMSIITSNYFISLCRLVFNNLPHASIFYKYAIQHTAVAKAWELNLNIQFKPPNFPRCQPERWQDCCSFQDNYRIFKNKKTIFCAFFSQASALSTWPAVCSLNKEISMFANHIGLIGLVCTNIFFIFVLLHLIPVI